ncbi:MAG: hypothetical protein DSZ32_02225 [Gammaproteobacteria bacterium]|nr:MAG: hypothetical protein DSZ32_02225 [Gammaproteobacteria bacterium]
MSFFPRSLDSTLSTEIRCSDSCGCRELLPKILVFQFRWPTVMDMICAMRSVYFSLFLTALLIGLLAAVPAHESEARGPFSYADAVDVAAPSVVNVNTSTVVVRQHYQRFTDPFLRDMFGDMVIGKPQKDIEQSLGSGVIVDSHGLILTNNHVIKGADKIQVTLHDGRTVPAKVVGTDPETDLAVLKVELTGLPVIPIADSGKLRVGDVVLAIGNPYGIGQSVTLGIVGATGRNQLGLSTFENFIQTDAAINPGNSGGALTNADGFLIGINTAIFSRNGGSQGVGFAIPSNMAKKVMAQIVKYGHPRRGWLGFEGEALNPALAKTLGMKSTDGLVVTVILRGGPAHKSGILPGDIITDINDQAIRTPRQALNIISSLQPGNSITLRITRNGKQRTIHTKVTARPIELSKATQ